MTENFKINILIDHHAYFNYTFCLHNYNFLKEIVLENTERNLEDVRLHISSSLGIFTKYQFLLDQLNKDQSYVLNHFDFDFNLGLIKDLSEKDIDSITIEISTKDKVIHTISFKIEVLPMDYFGGLYVHPELLVSYVLPNTPAIYKIKKEAIKILESNQMKPAFEGYQSHNKERILQMVSALFTAIQNFGFVYSAMPPSFEQSGQRIRLVEQVVETKFGNCIDITLLFAACLEAIDLKPLLIITKGHAFVGVWLEDNRMDSIVNFDQAALSKRIASGIKEIAIIESTTLCKGNTLSFNSAINLAESQLMDSSRFLLSIDVHSARINGVLPIPSVIKNTESTEESINDLVEKSSGFSSNYEIGTLYNDLELSDESNLTKQKVWERKLLDLSLRNNLLNLRFTKSMLQLVDLKINLLEDNLADGKVYTIHPSGSQPVLRKYNLYTEPVHPSQPLFKIAEDEFNYNRILTYYHNDDLDSILTHLYRNSKLAEEENGKSTLYLGIGLLKWYEHKNKGQPRFAPLLLIPVELARKSVNSKFTLRSREEETMVNITLLEYLRQEFKLDLTNLETLPTDESGVDVPKVLAIFRNAILNLPGWDILDQTVLGIFSFNKLILWQDISKYADEIQKSAIVKSLIDGRLHENLLTNDNENENLESLPAAELILPIPTDNSQLNAVKKANRNQNFILHGPPGTGKSQTITNIIADALANDKKVLFVAAKKAALDVVHSRLESIGLGPFCLELHSNKSKKSDVLAQFEKTLDVPKYKMNADFIEEANRIDQRKNELKKYVDQLHTRFKVGWTLFDSIAYLETNNVVVDDRFILPIQLDEITQAIWNNWNDWLIPFSSIVQKIQNPSFHSLRWVKIAEHQFDNKHRIVQYIEQYINQVKSITAFKDQYELTIEDSEVELILSFLEKNTMNQSLLQCSVNENQFNLFKNWLTFQEEIQSIEASIYSDFNYGILNDASKELNLSWNIAKSMWFLPRWYRKRRVKQQLSGYAKSTIESDDTIERLFTNINQLQLLRDQLNQDKFATVSTIVSRYLVGSSYDIETIQKEIDLIREFQEIGSNTSMYNFNSWILKFTSNSEFMQSIQHIMPVLKAFKATRINLEKYLIQIPQKEELDRIVLQIEELDDWINFNIYKEKASSLNLQWFIFALESNLLNYDAIAQDFEKIIHMNYFVKTVYSSEILNGFDAGIYQSLIQQYKELYQEFVTLSKNQLILKLSNAIPNFAQEAVQSSEIGILQKAIRSRGRGMSIRKLFDQIPTLIPRLKPCMLMSPISVAQYFDVNSEHFDLVIFDEASQLPTSEAISALARAKQAIIVGDPKQMPPTSFFASSKTDEDNFELEDLESILDDCLALSIPSNYLLRHYRSKHESLIAFSNANFYDNKLLTFPSPDDLNQKVTLEFINGFYDKGKTRTNKQEALAIIQYVQKHLASKNPKTLGIVTFSQTQQNLIEDLLQSLFQKEPYLEEFSLIGDEPIFVKNLENVQGDERDIILFSIGYGPDEFGHVSMNFGPLNRDGGWRRLNVAITRARYEMKVFSSLKADQIDLNRTKSEGVKGFKDFLNFAQNGIVYHKDQHLNKKSIFVESVADYLSANGLIVKANIGTSEYKVDIGIVNPLNETEYMLAIIIDGENYYNIHTTNDRELLAPSVLRSLGWNVYRIWTLDWIKNKEKALIEIKQLLKEIHNNQIVALENTKEERMLIESELSQVDDEILHQIVPYFLAEIKPISNANSETIYFFENRIVLQSHMIEIINTEAPISQGMLFKKILKLWNISRAGGKLTNYLTEIVENIPQLIKTTTYQTFYWSYNITPNSLRSYRENSIEKRPINDIALEEITIAVLEIMQANLSLTKEDLIRASAKKFGFLKVGAQIDLTLNMVVGELIKQNRLLENEGRILIV